jgi:hypothetical protein
MDNNNTNLTRLESSFPHTPAVYSNQLEVQPVLSLRASGCFGVTGGNLLSSLLLTLQHRMALSNMLLHFLPQNEFNTDLGINFIQQRDVSEEGRANTMFLGRTLDYTAES